MAGITHFEEFQKPTLRGLVDESIKDRTIQLGDKFLPNMNVYSTEVAYDIIKTSKYIAPMIGYGAEPPVVDRDAVSRALRGEARARSARLRWQRAHRGFGASSVWLTDKTFQVADLGARQQSSI